MFSRMKSRAEVTGLKREGSNNSEQGLSTARSQELNEAEPEVFVQLSESDAKRLEIREGEMVEISSRRGTVRAAARIGGIIDGHVFLPLHYGYWDENEDEHKRAANELTLTTWDPVSKQPHYKFAAVQVHKLGDVPLTEKLGDVAGKALDKASELTDKVLSAAHVERSRVSDYLAMLTGLGEYARPCAEHVVRVMFALLADELAPKGLEVFHPIVMPHGHGADGVELPAKLAIPLVEAPVLRDN
jgi:hypothetical protein